MAKGVPPVGPTILPPDGPAKPVEQPAPVDKPSGESPQLPKPPSDSVTISPEAEERLEREHPIEPTQEQPSCRTGQVGLPLLLSTTLLGLRRSTVRGASKKPSPSAAFRFSLPGIALGGFFATWEMYKEALQMKRQQQLDVDAS